MTFRTMFGDGDRMPVAMSTQMRSDALPLCRISTVVGVARTSMHQIVGYAVEVRVEGKVVIVARVYD